MFTMHASCAVLLPFHYMPVALCPFSKEIVHDSMILIVPTPVGTCTVARLTASTAFVFGLARVPILALPNCLSASPITTKCHLLFSCGRAPAPSHTFCSSLLSTMFFTSITTRRASFPWELLTSLKLEVRRFCAFVRHSPLQLLVWCLYYHGFVHFLEDRPDRSRLTSIVLLHKKVSRVNLNECQRPKYLQAHDGH